MDVNFQFPGGACSLQRIAPTTVSLSSTVPGLNDDAEKVTHAILHHTAFEYENFDDLMSSYARLKGLGIEPDACLNHGLTMSLYYADPDGNLVELQVDNFADWDQSSEWMRTAPEFAANPIGSSSMPIWFSPPMKVELVRPDPRAKLRGKYPPQTKPDLHLPQ